MIVAVNKQSNVGEKDTVAYASDKQLPCRYHILVGCPHFNLLVVVGKPTTVICSKSFVCKAID